MTLPDAETLVAQLAAAIKPTLTPNTVLVGMYTGGVWAAQQMHALLDPAMPHGDLDISFYRDDFNRIGLHAQVKPTRLPFEVEGRDILLVDDVLYTGRSVRAAMNALFDYGRPARIRLAVLVDRMGDRELPIMANFVGSTATVPPHQHIHLVRDDAGHLNLKLVDLK
ncbi:bifunctional pyr operon transcriptional regulator/uracil phosphoribosyltransferase PyrR [Sulfuriferula plumbiphila]|uniref:bifunctional pyr operon transcriptional regulator/uracil phosphoribosyltransferase PyrR n=1 Tax=Sulfuriferula plumbiphila TaxID=171865 RepID=UPI0011BE91DD|nr:bifunctional pyr operon transcriptional regulator/uracil phosphoribosyltransferase PyrR [Sulfuriferula plumbiphila]